MVVADVDDNDAARYVLVQAEAQDRYRALGQSLLVGIMDDVRRDGMDAVLRDRFTQFIPLATDVANREEGLLAQYGRALTSLDERR